MATTSLMHKVWSSICVGLVAAVVGCRTYVESTPRELLEGDNEANYRRVFRDSVPQDVVVVNSVVVAYSWRPGVVTTDDFEFELLVSEDWIQKAAKRFYLNKSANDFTRRDLELRKQQPVRAWYAPKPIGDYELWRDASSIGYVHMLVERAQEGGRRRVFISKH